MGKHVLARWKEVERDIEGQGKKETGKTIQQNNIRLKITWEV